MRATSFSIKLGMKMILNFFAIGTEWIMTRLKHGNIAVKVETLCKRNSVATDPPQEMKLGTLNLWESNEFLAKALSDPNSILGPFCSSQVA